MNAMQAQIERLANREIKKIEDAYERGDITSEERDKDIRTVERQAREELIEWERERYFANREDRE